MDSYPCDQWFNSDMLLMYLSHFGETRSRERIAALRSVYSFARNRFSKLDDEFAGYINRLSTAYREGKPARSVFPPPEVREKFCEPALTYDECWDIYLGLPDTAPRSGSRKVRLCQLEGDALKPLIRELASEAKSRALGRFYDAFLDHFEVQVGVAFNSDGVTVWSCVDSESGFFDALVEGFKAVETPPVSGN